MPSRRGTANPTGKHGTAVNRCRNNIGDFVGRNGNTDRQRHTHRAKSGRNGRCEHHGINRCNIIRVYGDVVSIDVRSRGDVSTNVGVDCVIGRRSRARERNASFTDPNGHRTGERHCLDRLFAAGVHPNLISGINGRSRNPGLNRRSGVAFVDQLPQAGVSVVLLAQIEFTHGIRRVAVRAKHVFGLSDGVTDIEINIARTRATIDLHLGRVFDQRRDFFVGRGMMVGVGRAEIDRSVGVGQLADPDIVGRHRHTD